MSERTTIVCDSCGKQAPENTFAIMPPKGWYSIRKNPLSTETDVVNNFHFCSPFCLHRWAVSERARQPEREAA